MDLRTVLMALVHLALAGVGGWLIVIDARTHRLPNRIVLPTLAGLLALVIGLVLGWHGWQALAVGAASAFVLGALYALVLIVLRRADGTTRIAFGPWMIAGAVVGIVCA